jgi:ketosteroid isomerase-like protein
MTNQSHLDTVKKLYAAFGAGDVEGAIGVIDGAVEWSVPGTSPWSGDWRGDGQVRRFFQVFGTSAALKVFEPRRFVADGDQVVVLGYEEGAARATGREWKAHFIHVFTVSNGKITQHREYVDTQAIGDAFRA